MTAAPTRARADAALASIALAALLAWEGSGLDLPLTRLFAGPGGFGWRDSFFTSSLLHSGGRGLAWAVLAALAVAAWRAPAGAGPSRSERLHSLAAILACLLLVPLLKRFSATSCPWDLAEFGGVAAYVPHWLPVLVDGGPGHCFPSGHAVAAFAFLPMFCLWRGHDRHRARAWLAAVLIAGLVFGAAQLVRGAHFASHTLWSAWLCWVIAATAARLSPLAARARVAAVGAAAPRLAPAAAHPGRRGGGR